MMSLAEYEELLADLVARDKITIEQAQKLRQMFINGEIREDDLPLPIEKAREKNNDTILLPFNASPSLTPFIITGNKKHDRNRVMQLFESYASSLALSASEKEMSLQDFHSRTMQILSGAMLANWLAGRGQDATPNIDGMIDDQLTYLYRFAGEMSARQALGDPPSEEYMVNRLLLYGGAVWAAWFIGNESYNYGDGYVAQYVAVDDGRTCQPCRSAVGYYRINEGPIPGQICYGGGRCRCERITVYAPEILARL